MSTCDECGGMKPDHPLAGGNDYDPCACDESDDRGHKCPKCGTGQGGNPGRDSEGIFVQCVGCGDKFRRGT